jgi:hypothetical protein
MQSKVSSLRDDQTVSKTQYVQAFVASPKKWFKACGHALEIKRLVDRYHPRSTRTKIEIMKLLQVMQEMNNGPLPGQ